MSKGRKKKSSKKIVAPSEVIEPKELPKRQEQGRIQIRRAELFVGPLPHPDLLAQYDKIVPNGADRIMCMAEKQMQHRLDIQSRLLDSDIRSSDRGLIFGFVIAITIIAGGFGLIIAGYEGLGIAAVIAPLVSIVGVFVYTRQTRKREEEEKESPPKITSGKAKKTSK